VVGSSVVGSSVVGASVVSSESSSWQPMKTAAIATAKS
jgi:hypothetical protein